MGELSDNSFILMLLVSDLLKDGREWSKLLGRLRKSLLSLEFDELLRKLSSDLSKMVREYLTDKVSVEFERSIGELKRRCQDLNREGIRITTVIEPNYPKSLKDKLKKKAPLVIFYAGDLELLDMEGLAIVGSRDVNEEGLDIARKLGRACARDDLVVFSGGARGVDSAAQNGCLESGGRVVSFLSCEMRRKMRNTEARRFMKERRLLIVSAANPDAKFSVKNAMERNKYIYAASKVAIVVASDVEGGTWSGANENLKEGYVPMFVVKYPTMPNGNRELLSRNFSGKQKCIVRELDSSLINEDFSPRKSIIDAVFEENVGTRVVEKKRDGRNTGSSDGQLKLFG